MTASSPPPCSVLIADADDLLRLGLSALLTEQPDFAVEAAAPGRATWLARRLQPQLIVVDPRRRDSLDLALIHELAAAAPYSRLCLHTAVFDPALVPDALLAGAHAYLLKGRLTGACLRQTLALVAQTAVVILDQAIIDFFRGQPPGTLAVRIPGDQAQRVTERERTVLALLAAGLTEKDIGARLGIRRTTVGSYARNLHTKLGADNAVQLGIRALEHGLILPPESLARTASTNADGWTNKC